MQSLAPTGAWLPKSLQLTNSPTWYEPLDAQPCPSWLPLAVGAIDKGGCRHHNMASWLPMEGPHGTRYRAHSTRMAC